MKVSDKYRQIRQENREKRDRRKRQLYKEVPRLKEISDEMASLSLDIILGKEENQKKISALDEERKSILKKRGYSDTYLDLEYNCEKCKDTGFIEIEQKDAIIQRECSCRKLIKQNLAYQNSSIKELLERDNFKTFKADLFRQTKQDNLGEYISPRENILDIKDKMQTYSEKFNEHSKSILFFGPTGSGKTFMLSCVAKEVVDRGYNVLYKTSSELLDFLSTYSFMFHEAKLENRDAYDEIYDVDLLIIDDLGSEYINDKSRSELFSLINSRLNREKPVMISSNIAPEEIKDIYGERLNSRIFGNYVLFEFFGNDLRMREG